jgi:hypothetical protein
MELIQRSIGGAKNKMPEGKKRGFDVSGKDLVIDELCCASADYAGCWMSCEKKCHRL